MLNFTPVTWKTALQVFAYFKQEFYDAQNINANLPHDSNNVFILFCLTQIIKELADNQNISAALNLAYIVVLNTTQFLEKSDIHYK